MANGILSDSELEIVTGGLENVGEDIYSYYGTCEDWTCEVCHKRCSDKCHICENGSISRAVCRYCFNYDSSENLCKLGRTAV